MDRDRLSTPAGILDRHVRLFNDGVRTGDFGPMASHLSGDAEMHFEGIPVGPFKGRAAIERAYSEQPPDDEIVILNVREEPSENVIVGEYAWLKSPEVKAGELRIVTKGDVIAKVIVNYLL